MHPGGSLSASWWAWTTMVPRWCSVLCTMSINAQAQTDTLDHISLQLARPSKSLQPSLVEHSQASSQKGQCTGRDDRARLRSRDGSLPDALRAPLAAPDSGVPPGRAGAAEARSAAHPPTYPAP